MTTPFSLEVAQGYARELVQKLAREKMDEGARKAEVKDFALLAARVYVMQKQDWRMVK